MSRNDSAKFLKIVKSDDSSSEHSMIFNLRVKLLGKLILFACFGLTLICLPSLFSLKTSYEVEQFFPKNETAYELSQQTKNKYKLELSPMLMARLESPKEQDWLNSQSASSIQEGVDALKTFPEIRSVMAFTNRLGAQMTESSLQVGKLIELTPEPEWKKRFSTDGLMIPHFLSTDFKSNLIYIELEETGLEKIPDLIRKIRLQFEQVAPDSKIQIGGIPALQSDFRVLLESETFRFLLFSLLTTILVVCLLFKDKASWINTFAAVLVGNIFSMTLMAWLGWPLTVLSVTIPILITVTVISQVVHTFFRLSEIERAQYQLRDILSIHKELSLPNFLSNLTTSAGFLTLISSDIPLISNYGLCVGVTIIISWLSTSFCLLGLSIFSSQPEPRDWTNIHARWVLNLLQWRRSVVLSVIAVGILASSGAVSLSWKGRLYDDLPEGHQARTTTETIDSEFGGSLPMELELTSSTQDAWMNPLFIQKTQNLQKQLSQLAGVGSVVSYIDFLKLFSGPLELPQSQKAAAELSFLYTMGETNPLQNYLSSDNLSTRLSIRLRDLPANESMALVSQIRSLAKEQFPEVTAQVSGLGNHVHLVNTRVSRDLIFGFWQAMLAIFIILAIIFRSFRWALVACIPNLVPPAVLLGSLALTQTSIKPPLALIFSISLGLAFNNTVYLLSRMREQIRKGRTLRLVEHVFRREGASCLHSTLVIMAGFGVFLFARFSTNQTFGAFMLLSILAGLVGDLLFLPSLLKWFPSLLLLAEKKITNNDLNTPDNNLNDQRRSKVFKQAAAICGLMVLFSSNHTINASTDPGLKARFNKSLKQFETKDEEANVRLSILESDGSAKVREFKIQRASGKKEERVLARIVSPADLKGTGLLSIVTKDEDNQWVYLPSSKQTRKVVSSGEKNNGVLGSELRYEDFNPSLIKNSEVTLARTEMIDGKKVDILETQLPSGKSLYESVQLWVENETDKPLAIDYFIKGKKVKTIQFQDFKKVGGVLRPHKMLIKNLKNKRGTDLEITELKVNKGVEASSLSVESLSKTW